MLETCLPQLGASFRFFAAGLGDMAVSNTIGSNVFDILVGLGVPWALQTMCVSYGSEVQNFFPQCISHTHARAKMSCPSSSLCLASSPCR